MAVKADWADGDLVHASDLNSLAAGVNTNSDDIATIDAVVTVAATKGTLATRATELNLATSTTETTVITYTLPTGVLAEGTTFRITVFGTVQTTSSSGTLTFRPYLGANVSTETFTMPNQSSARSASGFNLQVLVTVRTTGVSGSYVSGGYGRIEFTTAVALTTTTTTTAVVDTTASTPVIKLTAQWATSSSSNILKVETATIEKMS